MKEWYLSKEPRERRALIIAGVVLGITVIYLMIWEPISAGYSRAQKNVVDQQDTLRWMQQASAEVHQLRGNSGVKNKKKTRESLLALIERTAKKARIRSEMKKVEPRGNNQAQIWFEQTSFDNVVQWLSEIEQSYGVSISSITVSREEQAGTVNARILLSGES